MAVKKSRIVVLVVVLAALPAIPAVKYAQAAKEAAREAAVQAGIKAAEEARAQEELAAEQRRKQAEEGRRLVLASIHFQLDPKNELPVMSPGDLTRRLYDRRNPLELERGQKVRILATLDEKDIYRDRLHFMTSPAQFLFQSYDFTNFLEKDLQPLQAGDEVEFIGEFEYDTNDSSSGHYVSSTMTFLGLEVQKVPPF